MNDNADPTTAPSFEVWLRQVDAACWALAGLSIHDLPDVALADWHDDGVSAVTAARKAVRSAGSDGF